MSAEKEKQIQEPLQDIQFSGDMEQSLLQYKGKIFPTSQLKKKTKVQKSFQQINGDLMMKTCTSHNSPHPWKGKMIWWSMCNTQDQVWKNKITIWEKFLASLPLAPARSLINFCIRHLNFNFSLQSSDLLFFFSATTCFSTTIRLAISDLLNSYFLSIKLLAFSVNFYSTYTFHFCQGACIPHIAKIRPPTSCATFRPVFIYGSITKIFWRWFWLKKPIE